MFWNNYKEQYDKALDLLERQLDSVTRERDLLLSHIIGPKFRETPETLEDDLQPVKKYIPMRVKLQMAEEESRIRAQNLVDKNREIKEANERLEKEVLGGKNVAS